MHPAIDFDFSSTTIALHPLLNLPLFCVSRCAKLRTTTNMVLLFHDLGEMEEVTHAEEAAANDATWPRRSGGGDRRERPR